MTPPIGSARAGVVSQVGDAIPDSVIHQYIANDFTPSNWPDSEGTSDIDTISGLSFDSSAFDNGGVSSNAANSDYGQSDTMGSFGSSNIGGSFAVAFAFSTTDNGQYLFGVINDNNDTILMFDIGFRKSNKLGIQRRDNDGNQQRVQTTSDINDGSEYVCILNVTGGTDSDIDFYFGPTNEESSVGRDDGNLGTTSDFDSDMTYFAGVVGGSLNRNITATLGNIYWFDDSLSQSQRKGVFDSYDFYDPATDAP